jgi:hypothetical protein
MLSEAKHLPVKISFLAAPFMTTRPERRVTFLGYTTLDPLIADGIAPRGRPAYHCSARDFRDLFFWPPSK